MKKLFMVPVLATLVVSGCASESHLGKNAEVSVEDQFVASSVRFASLKNSNSVRFASLRYFDKGDYASLRYKGSVRFS